MEQKTIDLLDKVHKMKVEELFERIDEILKWFKELSDMGMSPNKGLKKEAILILQRIMDLNEIDTDYEGEIVIKREENATIYEYHGKRIKMTYD